MPRRNEALRNLRDGLALVCPVCHEGRMFGGYEMRSRCPRCDAPFEHDPGEFTGPLMFAMGIVGMIALMGWFVLEVLLNVHPLVGWAWLLWWGVVFPIAFYRNLKGLWVGIVYASRGPDQPLGVHEPTRDA